MQNAESQLIAALRLILAEGADPRAVIDQALEDIAVETPRAADPHPDAPGPYAPNPWSIYAERVH
ncbi:hypothetical protein [Methylobacterium oxalidis]|uniref:hypothetical protein n=1 Tax=Methylobacterium oxalidis TaxID=944322 RepID=UPI00331520D6